ncbi:MAG TPA: BMP family ABC transporter substrate-binding protein [Candidatus Coatesbacteria bacterium]|nr:BMP family ABC transporter substrate-binding protein [Candidatus Coatesbacteria bacterium]
MMVAFHRKAVVKLLLVAVLVFAAACEESAVVEGKFRLGVIYGLGGSSDKSFNEAIKLAVSRFVRDYRASLTEREPREQQELQRFLEELAGQGLDCIVVASDPTYLEPVALAHPDQHFILVDGEVELDNVIALSLDSRRAAAAVGAIAAMTTKTGRLGFIGAFENRSSRRVLAGYQEGALIAARLLREEGMELPEIEFLTDFVGSGPEALNNPPRAELLARKQYSREVDIIFAFCGKSAEAVFLMAKNYNRLAIGSDLNQNWIERGHILTCMLRNITQSLYGELETIINAGFTGRLVKVPLGNGGLGFYVDKYNAELMPEGAEAMVRRVFGEMDEREAELLAEKGQ